MQPTDPNKFTEKGWEAITTTIDIAKENKQQQLESEHLFKSLLEKKGLAISIFNKADVSIEKLRDRVDSFLRRQPKIGNMGDAIYLGKSLDTLLDRAEKWRIEFQDEFISIEHIILAYPKDDRFGKNICQELGLGEK